MSCVGEVGDSTALLKVDVVFEGVAGGVSSERALVRPSSHSNVASSLSSATDELDAPLDVEVVPSSLSSGLNGSNSSNAVCNSI